MSCDIWQPFESDRRADGWGRNAGAAQCLSVLQAITMIMKGEFVVHKKHEGFYRLHELMNRFWSKFWQLWSAHQAPVYLSTHGDCLQHTEALSSARIPASTVSPPVALKGLPDIATHLKG